MSVDPGISTIDARIKGFEDAVKADPKFTYLNVQYSHNDPATAANLMGSALQKDPDLVGVFAANLFCAEGTATGVRQANKGEQVKVVSFDAGPNQVKALKEGTVQALVAQQPEIIGQYGVDMAVAALDGGTVTPKVQTGFTIITKDNVDGDGSRRHLQVQLLNLTGGGRPTVGPHSNFGSHNGWITLRKGGGRHRRLLWNRTCNGTGTCRCRCPPRRGRAVDRKT